MKLSESDRKLLSTERLKATGRLASEIAHELNTPLGGIVMYSHLLLEDLPEDDLRRGNIVKINKLAHRCKIIVQGLLDFAHQDTPEPRPVHINRVIRNVVGFLEDHILLRRISIRMQLDSPLPRVQGDENKLEQVFINLLINAAQSMDGTGELSLHTEFVPETNRVQIECSDTGCGIDDQHLGKIFEPFFTTKEGGKGTGLGLSICHGIVEQYGGTIEIETSRGHGTTFTVSLPAAGEEIND